MRQLIVVTVLVIMLPLALRAQDKPIDLRPGDPKYRMIGELHEPLGTVMTVQGVIVDGRRKRDSGKKMLHVQRINGRATQEDFIIEVQKGWTEIGADVSDPKYGMSLEFKGYETGGFVGTPTEALKGLSLRPAVTDHHFLTWFVFHEGKRIDPVRFAPAEFVGREALIEGRAVSRERKAYIAGPIWQVLVDSAAPWESRFEGKAVEGFGMVRKTEQRETYRLEKGTTRLVKLEDQLGREVALRGTAWSMNGHWWLDYRGTELYVEGMKDLPGWKGELHALPVLITGILEQAMLHALDQITLKHDRDLKKYFIVRKPSWKPLDALLGPEQSGR